MSDGLNYRVHICFGSSVEHKGCNCSWPMCVHLYLRVWRLLAHCIDTDYNEAQREFLASSRAACILIKMVHGFTFKRSLLLSVTERGLLI